MIMHETNNKHSTLMGPLVELAKDLDLLITLMIEASTSETSVNYQTTHRNNPEDSHLQLKCKVTA
jgi:hypothetical protein